MNVQCLTESDDVCNEFNLWQDNAQMQCAMHIGVENRISSYIFSPLFVWNSNDDKLTIIPFYGSSGYHCRPSAYQVYVCLLYKASNKVSHYNILYTRLIRGRFFL